MNNLNLFAINSNPQKPLNELLNEFKNGYCTYSFKPSDIIFWRTNNERYRTTDGETLILPFRLTFQNGGRIRIYVNLDADDEDVTLYLRIYVNNQLVKSLFTRTGAEETVSGDIDINVNDVVTFGFYANDSAGSSGGFLIADTLNIGAELKKNYETAIVPIVEVV